MAVDAKLLTEYIDIYWRTFKNFDNLIGQPMKEFGLSFEQFMIMRDLASGHKLAVSEIARHRNVTRAAISRQIKTMLDQEYIIQDRDLIDRRVLYLYLTPKGEEITQLLNDRVQKRFDGWVELLGETDARELLRIMEKIRDLIMTEN